MFAPRTSRAEVLDKLNQKKSARIPILISSAASGLVARMLESAGADCINTFHGARLRANGMGTMSMLWPILDANDEVLRYTEEDILPALEGQAFVCICINANDPLRDMYSLLQKIKHLGVCSVSNIGPSISYYDKDSNIFRVLNKCGITFANEVRMLKLAKEELGMVTIGVAFDEEDSVELVEQARPDLFCYHAGTTKGGRIGYDSGESIESTAARSRTVNDRVRQIAPETLCIAHGAAMEAPADAQVMLDHAGVDGIWTGSSTERIPIEKAVFEAGRAFAQLRYSS